MADYKPKVYISGPMTGLPEFNYPAFNTAAVEMRALGWEVINPAENHGGRTDLPREEYFRQAIPWVARCDAILMLEGWRHSEGARLEFAVARMCGVRTLVCTQTPSSALAYQDMSREHVKTKAVIKSKERAPNSGALDSWPNARSENDIEKKTEPDESALAPEIRLVRCDLPIEECFPVEPSLSEADAGTIAFRNILINLWNLHMAKRKDYTGGGHPLANYINSAKSIGVDANDIMFARAYEKMHRISALRRSGKAPENESIVDSLYDVANLSLLQVMRLTPGSGYDTDV